MAAHDSLEGLLAEALQCLDNAARDIRSISELDTNSGLKKLGRAIMEIWELREQLHSIRPDLKPNFVVEYAQNPMRYDALSEISKIAHEYEESGDYKNAKVKFNELCSSAISGYFCMVGEAGLYRISNKDTHA